MYIGPWQEYRLAKIQDDVIQRLKKEWEDQLRGQVPTTEDIRIRELMQPLLPALLLASKFRGSSTTHGSNNAAMRGSRSGIRSEMDTWCSSRPQSAQSIVSSTSSTIRNSASKGGDARNRHPGASNQETHDVAKYRPILKPSKPTKKKGKKAPQLTALEQVQKRKKMFATWIKQAGNNGGDGKEQNTAAVVVVETMPETDSRNETVSASNMTRLPLISSAVPASAAALLGPQADTRTRGLSSLVLPPLKQLSESRDDNQDPASASSQIPPNDNLDESVDEDEVNNLLNWTDTLLSPHAMDSFCDFDD